MVESKDVSDTHDTNVQSTNLIGSSSDLNMSFGDALYLHPNNISGSPIVTIKLTSIENYKVWSIAMTFALRNHNKLGFIDGTCKRDKTNLALANQWDMCNSVIVTWILNSLSSELFAGAIYAKNAYEMWTDLKETYDKVDGSVFDAMIYLPTCTCDATKDLEKHNQLIKLMQFLMGLDDSYLAIRSNILGRETLPLVKQAFAIISSEESHRNTTSYVTTKPTATRNFNAKPTVANNASASADVLAKNSDTDNKTSNSPVSLTSDQLSRLMNLLNDNGVSSANSNMGGHPNGTQALITKLRYLKVNNDITLYDVLVVPEYTVSLLSVHKLARDSKLFMGFDENKCYFQDLKANKTVGIGRQCNGL
ncbi:ribonuclease H-like domain-containing protein [Tanacetum coccineum]